MVDQPRPPDNPGGGDSWPAWLRPLLAAAVGFAGLFRYLFGHEAEEVPPPVVPLDVPRHEVEEVRHPDGRIEHPRVGYERSDASFGWIFGLLVAAAVLAVIIHWAVWKFYTDYGRHQAAVKASPFPLAPEPSRGSSPEARLLPPEPRLEPLDRVEGIERSDVYQRQATKEALLNGYGRTAEAGYVHVPIEVAMDRLAGKLPARAKQPGGQEKANGLVDSGESNSGRLYRKEPPWFEH